jgi:small-conductance mechanosensitive channel
MSIQVVIDALTKIVTDIIGFIPNFVNGLIILIVGYLIARFIRWIVTAILSRVRFDVLMERSGVTDSLRGLGVRIPLSRLIGQAIFIFLLLSFLITSTRLMGLEAVAQLLEQLLTFLPNILAAGIVFVLGGLAAQFIGNLLTTVVAATGAGYASQLGRIVQTLIVIFSAVLALGVLGIDTSILVTALTIVIAAFGLALGLALGLGARNVVQHILAGYYLRQRLTVGQPIVTGRVRGEISGVGSVNTSVTTTEGVIVIPNNVLIETVVQLTPPGETGAAPPPTPPQAPQPVE